MREGGGRNGESAQNEASTTEVVLKCNETKGLENLKESSEEELEIVWSGGPLLPDRDQHPDMTWEAPKRKYNRKENENVETRGSIVGVDVGGDPRESRGV